MYMYSVHAHHKKYSKNINFEKRSFILLKGQVFCMILRSFVCFSGRDVRAAADGPLLSRLLRARHRRHRVPLHQLVLR